MKNLAIARRYAKALLMIGKEDGRTGTYRAELDRVSRMVESHTELKQVITNPLYDAAGRKSVLNAIIANLNLSKVMSAFLVLLFDKGRVGFLDNINTFYQKLADELKGVARASLVTASELSPEIIEKIRTTLSRQTGKDIILEVEQDTNLIGGIITKIGDLVLDGSIRTQLVNMKESLKRGESV